MLTLTNSCCIGYVFSMIQKSDDLLTILIGFQWVSLARPCAPVDSWSDHFPIGLVRRSHRSQFF